MRKYLVDKIFNSSLIDRYVYFMLSIKISSKVNVEGKYNRVIYGKGLFEIINIYFFGLILFYI